MGRKRDLRFEEPDDLEEAEGADQLAAKRRKRLAAKAQADLDDDLADASDARKRAKERDQSAAHTLESDEEDLEDEQAGEYEMQEEDLHEELDEKFEDGGVEVTAFNLKEEMQEGHFDEEGNFIFKKNDGQHGGDEWLQGAEVFDAKRKVEFQGKHRSAAEREKEEADLPVDRYEIMQQIIDILQPQESVAAAMKRLGGDAGGKRRGNAGARAAAGSREGDGRSSAAAASAEGAASDQAAGNNLQLLDRLTKLVEALMAEGMYEIFQETREKLSVAVRDRNLTKFVYKWTDDDEAEVHGPFTAQQMLEWQKAGFFGDGIFVRNVSKGSDAPYYPLSRVDFELFIDED